MTPTIRGRTSRVETLKKSLVSHRGGWVADVPRLKIPGRLGLMSNFSLDSLGGLSQQIPPYGGTTTGGSVENRSLKPLLRVRRVR